MKTSTYSKIKNKSYNIEKCELYIYVHKLDLKNIFIDQNLLAGTNL